MPRSRLALPAALFLAAVAAPAADDPGPLLKPVAPPNGGARARLPADRMTTSVFKGRLPRGDKKGGTVDVTVGLAIHGRTSVALKTWESWGYPAPQGGVGVLPELVLAPAVQVAPKPPKGADAEVRVAGLRVAVIDYPRDVAPKDGGYLGVDANDLAPAPAAEPRLFVADRFLELTHPAGGVRRPDTAALPVPEPAVTADPGLVPSAAPTAGPNTPYFAFVSANGQTSYRVGDGKDEPVRATFSYGTRSGLWMTVRMATGCGVEMKFPDGEWGTTPGKLKEFRLALQSGPGLKAPKDLVLKDVPVTVSNDKSSGALWFGTEFTAAYFKDAVYARGPDGVWRLHGRVPADLLADPKTRTPPAKKP